MYACLSSEITIFLLRTRDSSENNLLCRCVIIRSKSWLAIGARSGIVSMKVEAWSKLIPSLGGGSRDAANRLRETPEQARRKRRRWRVSVTTLVSSFERTSIRRPEGNGGRDTSEYRGEFDARFLLFPSPGDSGRRKMVGACY